MSKGGSAPQRSSRGASCAYLGFFVMNEWANIVHILAMCDALTVCGLDTELLLYPPAVGETPSAADLRQRYGLENTPRVLWIPDDANKWVARLRLTIESARAGRRCAYVYTRRGLAALGALLGGAHHVFYEIHQPIPARHDRLAFSIARHSRRLHVVCISRRLAGMVARQHSLDERTIIVEHTGHSFPIRRDYRVDSCAGRRLQATYVGTFAPGRGLEMIFELAKLHPSVEFVVVGPGQAPNVPVPDNIDLRGPVPHSAVPGLLSQADILLMPYTRHTMLPDGNGGTAEFCSPLKMFEYLSAGRSIIASDLPSISEILVNESNCLLVDPESVEQWSSAMVRLEQDVDLRARLARAAAETAEKHTMVGRVRRILEKVGERP
jgi:glycosyltransferase involved in cell wall biosynthesis